MLPPKLKHPRGVGRCRIKLAPVQPSPLLLSLSDPGVRFQADAHTQSGSTDQSWKEQLLTICFSFNSTC